MNRIHFIALLIFFSLCACKKERAFSEVKNLSEYKNTEFVFTTDNEISAEKNLVYCATLLFAWDEVRDLLNPIQVSNDYPYLKDLNDNNNFRDVLKKDEYKTSHKIEDDRISVMAEFAKSLPFEAKLNDYPDRLKFNNQPIPAFGVSGYSESEKLRFVGILYYKDDDNFIIRLNPKNKEHGVILFKSERKFETLHQMIEEADALIKLGDSERKEENQKWKYRIEDEDIVIIPKFNFNIETEYGSLAGNKFQVGETDLTIEKASQRTAFLLDEEGAEIESEAWMEFALEAVEEDERPKPKKMIFDKSFLTMLKRADAPYPYFAMWTANSELMARE